MSVKKPSFTGNVKHVEFLADRIIIDYHLQRNWNESDVIGKITLPYENIRVLPIWSMQDSDGVYINDKNGSFFFHDIEITERSTTIIVVFRNSWAGESDLNGDPYYPHDEIVGVFRHGSRPVRVKYDRDWSIPRGHNLPHNPIGYHVSVDRDNEHVEIPSATTIQRQVEPSKLPNLSDIIADIHHTLKQKSLVVFCGAGISMNSGLPDVRSLQRYILQKLGLSEQSARDFLEETIPFESFMDSLRSNTDIDPLLDIFTLGEPNQNHFLIAKLAKAGLLHIVCTTNFDTLVEKALQSEGVDYHVYYREEDFSKIDWTQDHIYLIKIHGTIEEKKDMAVTIQQVASWLTSYPRKAIVDHIFAEGEHEIVFIMGYSCSDEFDISKYIRRISKNHKRVILLEHTEIQPAVEVEPIDLKKGKNPFGKFATSQRVYCNTDNFVSRLEMSFQDNTSLSPNSRPIKQQLNWQSFVDCWSDSLDLNEGELRYYVLGWLFAENGDLVQAREFFRNALLINDHLGNVDHAASCHLGIAEGYLSQAEYEHSLEEYGKALQLYSDIKHDLGIAKSHRGIADCLQAMQNFDQSILHFEQAANLFNKKNDDFRRATCLTGYATNEVCLGHPDRAIIHFTEALSIFEEFGEMNEIAGCLNGLGNAHYELKQHEKARERYSQALKISEDMHDLMGQAICWLNLGNVYNCLRQPNSATNCLGKSLNLYESISDEVGMARCYLGIGNAQWGLGNLHSALEYFQTAQAIFKRKNIMRDYYGTGQNISVVVKQLQAKGS